eukprot:jgi/Mesen1/9819/ME000007S09888
MATARLADALDVNFDEQFASLETVAPELTLKDSSDSIVLSNSKVSVTFARTGHVTGISYAGVRNLLINDQQNNKYPVKFDRTSGALLLDGKRLSSDDLENFEYRDSGLWSNRGYWDVDYSTPRGASHESFSFTGFRRVSSPSDTSKIEIAFTRPYKGKGVPLDVELRALRLVLKLNPALFTYMALADDRQEARLMVNPENANFDGMIEDKYHYSDTKNNVVHGWISNASTPVGLWLVSPHKTEYLGGGPTKQELTPPSCTRASLAVLACLQPAHRQTHSEVHGGDRMHAHCTPALVHTRTHAMQAQAVGASLWQDAKGRAALEQKNWPYGFPSHAAYAPPGQRGKVTGRLVVRDAYVKDASGGLAWVGLAPPGPAGSWTVQFWTQADASGNFVITGVIRGKYTLHGYVPGVLGDYVAPASVSVSAGQTVSLRVLTWKPTRLGPTVWEIGTPDKSSGEFFCPVLNPRNLNYPYPQATTPYRYRNYGGWLGYIKTYPIEETPFVIGKSDPAKDWFYTQPARLKPDGSCVPTTRQIKFNLSSVQHGTYNLRFSVAATTYADVQVRVNSIKQTPRFHTSSVPLTGGVDNALARASNHGTYVEYTAPLSSSLFKVGWNSIFLTQRVAAGWSRHVMYDYLRLEGPR